MQKVIKMILIMCILASVFSFTAVNADVAPKIKIISTETETEINVEIKASGDIQALWLYDICVGYTAAKLSYKANSAVIQTPPGWTLDVSSDQAVNGNSAIRYVRVQNGFLNMGTGSTLTVQNGTDLLIASFTLTKLGAVTAADIFQSPTGFKYGVLPTHVTYSYIRDTINSTEGDISMKTTTNLVEHTFIPLSNESPGTDFVYNDDGTNVTITDYVGAGGAVVIPAQIGGKPVKAIGDFAINNKPNVTSITVPEGVTSIGAFAFAIITSLTEVSIPASVTAIGEGLCAGCDSLTEIQVAAGNQNYSGQDGVLFDKAKTVLMQYPGAKTGNYVIPSGVTNIGNFAFYNSTALSAVTIPSSTTSIGTHGFYNCTALGAINLPNNLANIGTLAFYGCTALTQLTIPSGVENIGEWAFQGCTGLTSVTFADGVTGIGDNLFHECEGLTSVKIPASVTSIGSDTFGGVVGNLTIYGAEGSYAQTFAQSKSIPFQVVADPVPSGFKGSVLVPVEDIAYEENGIVAFDLYGAEFTDLKVLMIEFTYDPTKLILQNSVTDENTYVVSDDGNGNVIIIATLPEKISSEDAVKLFTLRFKMTEESINQTVTVRLERFAGGFAIGDGEEAVAEIDEESSEGTVTITTFTYDINGDGTINLGDLVYAETFYGAKEVDGNWSTAKKADSDGDKQITTADFVNIALYIATHR